MLIVCLTGLLVQPAWTSLQDDPPAPEPLFDATELVLGPARSHVVLPGFLRGGALADLAVASVTEDGGRRLAVHSLGEGGWTRALDLELDPEVLFVDVGRVGGEERLLTYAPGRLCWVDPTARAERVLVEVSFDCRAARDGAVFFADVTHDLNGDGADDLVFPGREGFQVLIQDADGSFSEPLVVGPPEPHLEDKALVDPYTYGEMGLNPISIPWYLGRVHGMDVDGDGRRDLAFWNADHFEVHLQGEDGTFSEAPQVLETEVPFETDGEYSLQYTFRTEDVTMRALHSIGDLDGDGIADLVVVSMSGPGIFKRMAYEVHRGSRAEGGLRFSKEPDTAIRWPSIAHGLRRRDLDGDGCVDLQLTASHLHEIGLLGMMMLESYTYELQFHRMQDRAYSGTPAAVRQVTATKKHSPMALVGDVSGDGRADLLLGVTTEEAHVFLGVPGPELFAAEPRSVAVQMPPEDEASIDYPYRFSRLVDLDRDGKLDLLVHRPSSSGDHRVSVLFAR